MGPKNGREKKRRGLQQNEACNHKHTQDHENQFLECGFDGAYSRAICALTQRTRSDEYSFDSSASGGMGGSWAELIFGSNWKSAQQETSNLLFQLHSIGKHWE